MNHPTEHLHQALQLTADDYVDLIKIEMLASEGGGVFYLKSDDDVWWQGQLWEGMAISISGITRSADEKVSRPTLVAQNPDGLFSAPVRQRALHGATVTLYRVLSTDLRDDRNVSITRSWWVSRVNRLNRVFLSVELREQLDGPHFVFPSRTFSPPDFPSVRIK